MRRSVGLVLLVVAGSACEGQQTAGDGGCVDAGSNTVCGEPQPFNVRFAGLDFPMLDDAGNPLPTVLDVVLADQDLGAACSASGPVELPPFTAVDIQVNGYQVAVDAGTYTSPTASAYEITWDPDAGATVLGESDETWVQLTRVTPGLAVGYFSADMALPTSGSAPLWGDFAAKSCQGLHAAIGPAAP